MAEIMQKIVQCPKRHYYDANKNSTCPTCANGGFQPTIDPFATGSNGTSTPDVAYESNQGVYPAGNFSHTIAPPKMNHASDKMSHTVFVDSSTPEGAPSPIVGWLVAVSGPCRGNDFHIHTGYNYVGREVGDICIHGDNTISAEKDTNITYVYQTNKFYIAHEQGRNVLLVNDVPALGGATEIKSFDRITIGSTKLVFVAFCCEKFSWDGKGAE